MSDFIEGRRAVEEALRAGMPIKRAIVAMPPRERKGAEDESAQAGRRGRNQGRRGPKPTGTEAALQHLVEKLRRAGVRVEMADKSVLDRISEDGSHGAHQGIVCEVPPFKYADLMDIARAGAAKEQSLVIVCDHITDEGNLGAIIRTADVVGADGVVIANRRAAQVNVGVYKTSAGAAVHVPVARVANITSALETLKKAGFWVAGASEKAPTDIWHSPMAGRVALVAGSEGEGISQLVLRTCDYLVSLPQRGHVGSLNVAQATTAICYEWMRQCAVVSEDAGARLPGAPKGAKGKA